MKYTQPSIRRLAAVAYRHSSKLAELKALVLRGRELFAKNPRSNAWLQISLAVQASCRNGKVREAWAFHAAGIAPDEPLQDYFWHSTMLHSAAGGNGARVLSFLVEQRVNLNVRDGRGYTPLHQGFTAIPPYKKQLVILARAGANLDVVVQEPKVLGVEISPLLMDELRKIQMNEAKNPSVQVPAVRGARIGSIRDLLNTVSICLAEDHRGFSVNRTKAPSENDQWLDVDDPQGWFDFHLMNSMPEAVAFADGYLSSADDTQSALTFALPDGTACVATLESDAPTEWHLYDWRTGAAKRGGQIDEVF